MRGNQLLKYLDKFAGSLLLWILGSLRSKNTVLPTDPRRIIIVKLSAIGDTLLLYPSLRALKAKYPKAEIAAVCTKINQEIFYRCRYIDKVIAVNLKDLLINPVSVLKPLWSVRPDLAVDFDQWTRLPAILALATRPKYLLGFSTEGQKRHYAFDLVVPHSRTEHEIDCFLGLAGAAGAMSSDTGLEFSATDRENKDVEIFLNKNGIAPKGFIVMHPETPIHGRQRHWPAHSFIELGRMIISQTDKHILLTGTKTELSSNLNIKNALGERVICVPPVTIGFLAALYAKASALICGNTGIMHLACAMDTPIVALHGPTSPLKWGPRTRSSRSFALKSPMACSPCLYLGFEYGCNDNACMRSITAELVFENVKNLLQNQS